MEEKTLTNQQEIDRSIDQLKHFLLKTMSETEIEVRVHPNKLKKMTLYAVKNIHEGIYQDWECSG